MPASPIRYKRLLQELPKHKTAQKALEASGFSKNTARTHSKSVLRSAVRHHAKELLAVSPKGELTGKQLMNEILGITSSELFNRLKWLALENDKDAGTALKILAPLVKEHGVILSAEDDSKHVSVPILNIIVDKPVDNPMIEQVEQSTSTEDGSTKP